MPPSRVLPRALLLVALAAPVAALNEQLGEMGRAADSAEMSAAINRLFDGVRRRRDAGEISELYARFILGEAAKPLNGSHLDDDRKKSLNSRLGAEMGRYSSSRLRSRPGS